MLVNKTINSQRLSEYVSRLSDWIDTNNTFGYEKVLLMLNNCPSQRSEECMKLFKALKHQVIFYPAYSPQLAPIEMWFNII